MRGRRGGRGVSVPASATRSLRVPALLREGLQPMLVTSCSSPSSRVCPSPSCLLQSLRLVPVPLPGSPPPAPVPQAGLVASCGPCRCPEVRRPGAPGRAWEWLCCVGALGLLLLGSPQLRGSAALPSLSRHWHISRACS